jgi:HD-like signal output (HDOD) protein/ActR/RegA family two-component response regulator
MSRELLRVLFVDDDTALLDGLKNRLRRHRDRWTMAFAPGGVAALALLEKETFEVVVTDMRMPQVDGAQLLEHVHLHHPKTLRIVLSGQSEMGAILRVAPIAHRYLSKPCDIKDLEEAIERAFSLRSIVSSDSLRTCVGGITSLPPLPRLYLELTQALKSEDATVGDVAGIISRDVAMSAKLLQLANSGLFHGGGRIIGVDQALKLLGFDSVRSLVLSAELFGTGKSADPRAVRATERAHVHAIAVAKLASELFPDPSRASEAFLAGMVHDLGRLVLETWRPGDYEQVERLVTEGSIRVEAERTVYGTSHCEVGAYLLELWGLPQSAAEAAAFHHTPRALPHTQFDIPDAVHVADALVDECTAPSALEGCPLDMDWLTELGVAPRLESWRKKSQRLCDSLAPGPRK